MFNETKTEKCLRNEMYETLKPYQSKKKHILDIGAHDCYLSNILEYKTYTMIDLQFKNDLCKRDIIKHEMDIREFLKINEKKYDLIVMSLFIEHIPEIYKLINSSYEHMSNDGLMYIRYPNARSINRIVGVEMNMLKTPYDLSPRDIHVGHIRMFDINFIYNINKFCKGFNILDFGGYMFKPLPNKMMDEYFGDELEKFIELGKKIDLGSCAEIWCLLQKKFF